MKKFLIIGNNAFSILNFRKHMLLEAQSRGYQIHCVVYEGHETSHIQNIKELGWACHTLKISRKGVNPWHDFQYFLALRKLLNQLKPEYMFSYTIKPVIYAGLAFKSLGAQIRSCAMITGLGYAFMDGGLKRKLINLAARFLYKLSLHNYNLVVFQNPDDQELFAKLSLTNKKQKVIRVGGSGVVLEDFEHTPLEFSGEEKIKFLMIARVLKAKGVFEFLQAAKTLHNDLPGKAEFAHVGPIDLGGDGIDAASFKKLCIESGVQYHGEQNNVQPFIKWCHVFVLPSYREGLPRSVIEAMAIGRAIITTQAPGCRETVISGENGYLVNPGDTSELLAAMKKCLSLKPNELENMATKSRHICEQKFDVRLVNRAVLDELLNF